jgi:hypothetical protein
VIEVIHLPRPLPGVFNVEQIEDSRFFCGSAALHGMKPVPTHLHRLLMSRVGKRSLHFAEQLLEPHFLEVEILP